MEGLLAGEVKLLRLGILACDDQLDSKVTAQIVQVDRDTSPCDTAHGEVVYQGAVVLTHPGIHHLQVRPGLSHVALPLEETTELPVVTCTEHGTALSELIVESVEVITNHPSHREARKNLRGGCLDGMDPAL